MEIIKKGERPEEKWLNGTCLRCKTEVRFQIKEARAVEDRQETFYQVDCPTCNGLISGYKAGPQYP